MQYQVPQFIEIEDKIFGPLTLKQFLYLAGGGGICLLFITILPLFIALVVIAPVVALSLALAFYKVNDRPFIVVLEHAFYYVINSKLYLWKQRDPSTKASQPAVKPKSAIAPLVSTTDGKLKDLAFTLNVKEVAPPVVAVPEDPAQTPHKNQFKI